MADAAKKGPRIVTAEEFAGAPLIPVLNVGPITNLVPFSIRNGAVEDARSLLVRPNIPTVWHWRPIRRLNPTDAIAHIGAFIQMYTAQITTQPPVGNTPEQNRKLAIILGVARAVLTSFYEIQPTDLIVEEMAAPWLEMVRGPDNIDRLSVTTEAPENVRATLVANAELTEAEVAAVAAIHMSAIGILPLQGYSLSICAHHYLTDAATQSRRAFEVVERTHWTSSSVSPWFNSDVEKIRDVIWHKVGHPVNLAFKRRLAFSPSVAKRLVEAGAGAAASRLPAIEPEMRAAKSYRTLCQTVRPLLKSYGGELNYDILDVAVNAVQAFPAENPTEDVEVKLPEDVPVFVRTRNDALKWLQQVMEKNKDLVAFAFGFYTSMAEQNEMLSGGASADTLRTSFSLNKLRTQSFASYVAGQQAYGDYTAHRNATRAGRPGSSPHQ